MDMKKRLLELLGKAFELEEDFMQALPAEELEADGTFEKWSARDVLAHCTFWQQDVVVNLERIRSGREPVWIEDYNAQNEIIFNQHRQDSWETVRELLLKSSQSLQEAVRLSDTEDLLDPDYLQQEHQRPAWQHILGSGYIHLVIHLAEYWIQRGRDELARQIYMEMTDLVAPLDEDPAWQGTVLYNRACIETLTGFYDEALKLLERAFRLRPDLIDWAKQDGDLSRIQGDPEFIRLTG